MQTWIVSVDDHVIEPPNVWTSRLPQKYQNAAPRIEKGEMECWVFEGRPYPTWGLTAAAGKEKEERIGSITRLLVEGPEYRFRSAAASLRDRASGCRKAGWKAMFSLT